MDKKHCVGCEDNFYNNGGGGAKECWLLEKAELIMRKQVAIDQVPPWKQAPVLRPDCYRKRGYVFVKGNQTE